MITIGITGGVGAGKSEVLKYISENYNAEIMYADRYAEELEMPGGACYEPLVSLLGEDVLTNNLEIDRKKMSFQIFSNPALLNQVNDIVHPAVKTGVISKIEELKAEGEKDFFFLEAALLIECGYKEILDELWYIYADEDIRRKRLKSSRGYSDEKVDNILASQLDSATFAANADFIVDNSQNLETTFRQIDERMDSYKIL